MLKKLFVNLTEQIDEQDSQTLKTITKMDRLDILKLLAQKNNAKSYLEIGVGKGYTFRNLKIDTKIGVDPDKKSAANVFMTSDDFFLSNNQTFDLIFIDGLHHADQVERDINNSLESLNNRGYILCHDMLPNTEIVQLIPRNNAKIWLGDCWKAWVKIRSLRNDVTMYVIDTDHGCGVICKGNQEVIKLYDELNYQNFSKYKQEWMNIVSIDEFFRRMVCINE